MNLRFAPLLFTLLTLAACVSAPERSATAPGRPPIRSAAIPTVRPSAPLPRTVALIRAAPGLEGVIGADADQLTRLFGAPRLDIRDEDARKLQWTGPACVLDAYLYEGTRGGRATATYVDARRGDGRDVDRAACVASLRRRPPVPSAP